MTFQTGLSPEAIYADMLVRVAAAVSPPINEILDHEDQGETFAHETIEYAIMVVERAFSRAEEMLKTEPKNDDIRALIQG